MPKNLRSRILFVVNQGLTFPLRGRGTTKWWMRCVIRADYFAFLTRSAIFVYLISRLRRQLEVNCPLGQERPPWGVSSLEKLNLYFYIFPYLHSDEGCAPYKYFYTQKGSVISDRPFLLFKINTFPCSCGRSARILPRKHRDRCCRGRLRCSRG